MSLGPYESKLRPPVLDKMLKPVENNILVATGSLHAAAEGFAEAQARDHRVAATDAVGRVTLASMTRGVTCHDMLSAIHAHYQARCHSCAVSAL